MRITRLPGSRWLKRALVAAVLVAIVAVVVWTLLPQPVPVEVGAVTRGELVEVIDEDARARVQDRHVVTAPLAGEMARIELEAGDAVAPGAVITRIVPAPAPLLDPRSRAELEGRLAAARSRRSAARAAVQRAEAAATFAQDQLARARRLAEAGAIARVDAERRQLEADVAARDLESARFEAAVAAEEVETARALLARAEHGGDTREALAVVSPVGGQVLRVVTDSAGVVAPGTPLVELGDPTRLEVVADLLTADAALVEPGAAVTLTGWGGPPLEGVVRRVEPSARTEVSALGVEEQRVDVVIDLTSPREAWQRLGDGWWLDVRIAVWRGDDVVQVPLGALFRDRDQWAVYVVEDGRARLRHVELGHRGRDAAEVRAGLEPGDVVILHPTERVEAGVAVDPS